MIPILTCTLCDYKATMKEKENFLAHMESEHIKKNRRESGHDVAKFKQEKTENKLLSIYT